MTVHVVVPTFRESELVPIFLQSWEGSAAQTVVHVVNGNPGDETSAILANWPGRLSVEEVPGSPALFWTGLCCLGLERVAQTAAAGDLFVLANIDVRFEGDPLADILAFVGDMRGKQVAVPVVGSSGRLLSAGVQVRSWALSRNRHIYDGLPVEELPEPQLVEATYLPTRFLVCPVSALHAGIFPARDRLPHYCADYEYTNRLRRSGYRPIIFTGARVSISEENTGFDTYQKRTSLWSRLKGAVDIKCAYNFRYRWRFVRLTYPAAAQIPGMLTHFAKIFLEMALGGRHLERWRSR